MPTVAQQQGVVSRMAEKVLSRKHKALALVPLALISGAWTASLASFGTANASATDHGHNLPDGTTVPSQAIEAPANLPQAGVLAPGVPAGTADQVVDNASTSGIPSAALSAYQRSAQIIDAADTTCQIPWELIAAIGRVESDHGRYGGNVLNADGVSEPGIFGIPLDGKNGTQAIQDTDGGAIDDDTVFDRAVGPMQFIPSTWQIVKVDADGDGKRDPQDIDDASLATAVYLCSGSEDLGTRKGQESAVFRYNHSQEYVDLVLRLMQAYMDGDYTAVPTSASGGGLYSLNDYTDMNTVRGKAKHKKAKAALAAAQAASGQTSGGQSSTGTDPVTGKPLPAKPGSGLPTKAPNPVQNTATDVTQTATGTATNVAQTLNDLNEAASYCRSHLQAATTLPVTTAAINSCVTQVGNKTEADANKIIGGVVAGV
ncbi:MAG: Transglycosylase protein, partial [Nocardioidaceae bacterium]|nr:Transglycosylase protein [Nocardioidaceae bacterium]